MYKEDFQDERNTIWDLAVSILAQKFDFVLIPQEESSNY